MISAASAVTPGHARSGCTSDGAGQLRLPVLRRLPEEWFLSNPAFGETREDRCRLLFTGGLRIHTTLRPGVQAAQHARSTPSSRTRMIPRPP